jgi:hypothetical protein
MKMCCLESTLHHMCTHSKKVPIFRLSVGDRFLKGYGRVYANFQLSLEFVNIT